MVEGNNSTFNENEEVVVNFGSFGDEDTQIACPVCGDKYTYFKRVVNIKYADTKSWGVALEFSCESMEHIFYLVVESHKGNSYLMIAEPSLTEPKKISEIQLKEFNGVSVGNVSNNSGIVGNIFNSTVDNSPIPLDSHQKLLLELYNKLSPIDQVELIASLHKKTK